VNPSIVDEEDRIVEDGGIELLIFISLLCKEIYMSNDKNNIFISP
jgi:hypothetical protein